MENLWIKAHKFVLDCKVGDSVLIGQNEVFCVRKTKNRTWFSNGVCFTIKTLNENTRYFVGKSTNQMLRDIEGYFIMKIHTQNELGTVTF